MKAGVLGVLLLGGLYFWGPLVWKWVGKKGAEIPTTAVVPPSQEPVGTRNASGQRASGAEEKKETGLPWREIRDRREQDPLARSAKFRHEWSQIFQVAATVAATEKSQAETRATKQVEVDPRKLGILQLQGIAIGPNSKKAVINGKVYRELDVITLKRTSDRPELKFRLVKVFRRMVEVERGGKTWPLTLASAEPEAQKPKEDDQAEQPKDKPTNEQGVTPVKTKAEHVEE